MSNENRDQQVEQLLRGIYRLCVNKDECYDCPFFNIKCMFEEPKPRTWFDEDSIKAQTWPAYADQGDGADQTYGDDSEGTWLVSTTMGSAFTKYVFICSKCGYRKESMFSFTPMTYCPECEKKKAK